jgi:peroxiredoxin
MWPTPLLALFACAFLAGPAAMRDGVADAPANICPALIGHQLPSTTLRTLDGAEVDLRTLTAEKPTVLVFYRGGWCPYCNKQLSQLKQVEPLLLEQGFRIVAVSPDSPESMRATVDRNGLTYTLLSDPGLKLARLLGLAFKARPEDFGQPEGGMPSMTELPVPAVFLVAPNGRILYQYVNVDYRVRLSGELLVTAAKAYGLAR